jgi:hypothetical protein
VGIVPKVRGIGSIIKVHINEDKIKVHTNENTSSTVNGVSAK